MESDYDFASAVYGRELDDPAEVGRRAGERAVRRLHAKKPPTRRLPVVFDPRISNSLLRHLAGAISGPSIARGTSFLKDKLDRQVRSEEHTSELQSLMRISYAVFCLKKKKQNKTQHHNNS